MEVNSILNVVFARFSEIFHGGQQVTDLIMLTLHKMKKKIPIQSNRLEHDWFKNRLNQSEINKKNEVCSVTFHFVPRTRSPLRNASEMRSCKRRCTSLR
jgi:actin-related protein